MGEIDPNRPPNERKDEWSDLGRRIQENVHDEIKARVSDRQSRWQERMARREARRARRGMGGGGLGIHGASGGLVVGLILAGIGGVLLLQNLEIIPDRDLWDFWPVIFIVAGISRGVSAYSLTGRIWGGIVALAGVLFLAGTLGFIHRNMLTLFWPAVLILAGGVMLVRALERNQMLDQKRAGGNVGTAAAAGGATTNDWTGNGRSSNAGSNSPNVVHEFAIFGGGNRRIDSQDFQGGSAVALFGGVQLDLRKAAMTTPEINIDVTAAFGGVEIKVPETWAVSMRVTSVFGGYDDKTHVPPMGTVKPPVLVVTGAVIFGGLSVKN